MASTTVIAPASISVISARYRPLIRSAGRPTSVPSTIVIRPEPSSTSGNGSPVANSSRAATQAPMARTAPWPSDTMPDASDQHAEAEGDDRVDRRLGHGVDVVQAEQRRQADQHEHQQRHDHGGSDAARPVRRSAACASSGRPAGRRRLGRLAVACLGRLHASGLHRDLDPLAPDRDHAPAVEDEQRDGRQHERRHVAVVGERRVIGVSTASTTPITIAATNVTAIERSRAISAAASDEITRKVSVVGVERDQVGEQQAGDARRARRSRTRPPPRPAAPGRRAWR